MSGKCPVMHGGNTSTGTSNKDWWPEGLNLDIFVEHLRTKYSAIYGLS